MRDFKESNPKAYVSSENFQLNCSVIQYYLLLVIHNDIVISTLDSCLTDILLSIYCTPEEQIVEVMLDY